MSFGRRLPAGEIAARACHQRSWRDQAQERRRADAYLFASGWRCDCGKGDGVDRNCARLVIARHAIDCRPAVPEHEWRSRAGVLCRRHGRRHHHGIVPLSPALRDRPQFVVRLRQFTVVAIKQRYPGHAKQAGVVAAQCFSGGYQNRFTVVVDDDIDPTRIDDVVWALSTRCDPENDIDIMRRCWSSSLDPMIFAGSKAIMNFRGVIVAFKPYDRMIDLQAITWRSTA